MTDNLGTIFLSYSRQDAEQARKLEAALQAKGRLLWVDWNSIPPTAVWLEEIHRAIVAASAFAFAVSPGSVGSDMCRLELDYAIRAGKRLIPLLFRATLSDLVPEGLKPIQWIDFTSQEDLAGPVHELLLAIDKDPVWVAFHTRLAIRAREWRRTLKTVAFSFVVPNWLGRSAASRKIGSPIQSE